MINEMWSPINKTTNYYQKNAHNITNLIASCPIYHMSVMVPIMPTATRMLIMRVFLWLSQSHAIIFFLIHKQRHPPLNVLAHTCMSNRKVKYSILEGCAFNTCVVLLSYTEIRIECVLVFLEFGKTVTSIRKKNAWLKMHI